MSTTAGESLETDAPPSSPLINHRPGDHVMFKTEDMKRPAIVQSVNAVERTAQILFPDTGEIELASLLELDAHGNSDLDANNLHTDSFGVRRGDFVFIHAAGTTNGMERPRVPRIGEIEPWVRENPFANGELSGWRKEMSILGNSLAARRTAPLRKRMQRPVNGDGKLLWCGEVTGVCYFHPRSLECPLTCLACV